MERDYDLHAKVDKLIARVESDHDILIVNNERMNNISKDVEVLFDKDRRTQGKIMKYALGMVTFVCSIFGFNKWLGL